MFLSKLEWLVLALALFLVPGSPWGAEPSPTQPPSAAAGGTKPPKQE